MMKNIVLTGFMGSGKTTIAKAIERKMGISFVDTDELIETYEQSKISEIFNLKGEKYFRKLETKILKNLIEADGLKVLSTGGGIITNEENILLLKQLGTVFYLRIKPETVVKRLDGDVTRPLLLGEDKLAKVEKLMNERKEAYEKTADVTIDVDDISVEKIVGKIVEKMLDNSIA
ncbi:MAG: shikimate kinase [Catonella sp.]|uniref:shikimate kinase n=1 Tax=Catonella sp. TaxID=2382125 RepID=UPI003F9F9FA3